MNVLVRLREVRRLLRQDRRDRVGRRVAAEGLLPRRASRRGSSRRRRGRCACRRACRAPAPATCSPWSPGRRPAQCPRSSACRSGRALRSRTSASRGRSRGSSPARLSSGRGSRASGPDGRSPSRAPPRAPSRSAPHSRSPCAGDRSGGDPLAQRLALEELRHDVGRPVGGPDVVDRGDVRDGSGRPPPAPPARSGAGDRHPARTSRGRTLIATSRPSRGSFARYTSPIPPAPMGARIS